MPIGFNTSQALNFVGASNPNQVLSISVKPEILIVSFTKDAVIENGVSSSISLIDNFPTIVSSTFESKFLLGITNSSNLNTASGNNFDSSHWDLIAESLIELLLFNVEISTRISRLVIYKQESD